MTFPRHRPLLLAALAAALLAGCGNDPPPRAVPASVPQSANLQVGDLTVRASAVQTSALGPAVASEYGIERGDETVLLLVALRRGDDGQEVSVPARVEATVTDLRGQRHALELRELRSGELLDYVGTVQVSLPDTLRFELRIVPEGGRVSNMQFTREFHPR